MTLSKFLYHLSLSLFLPPAVIHHCSIVIVLIKIAWSATGKCVRIEQYIYHLDTNHCDPSHIAIMFNINTLTILVLGQVFAQMNIYKWMMNMWPEFIWRLRKCKAGFAFLLEIKVANIFKTIFYENITSPVNMEFKIWENVTGKWMFCAKSKEGKWKVRVQQCCSDKNNLSRVLKIKWSKINIQQLGSLMSKNNFCSKFS